MHLEIAHNNQTAELWMLDGIFDDFGVTYSKTTVESTKTDTEDSIPNGWVSAESRFSATTKNCTVKI